MIYGALVGCVVTALSGLFMIPALKKYKFGQSILEDGPRWHMSKQGTPTMGGFMFMTGITIAVIALGWNGIMTGQYAHIFILIFAWLYGMIGFIDDYAKIKKKQNKGLTALQKLLLQLAVAAAFLALLRYFDYVSPDVYIPFVGITISLPWLVYLGIGILLVAGFVNAVNLTDGVDGLCSGVTLPVAVTLGLVALNWDRPVIALFAGALAGSVLGFLFYNFHPAKVFMGDTGSLFIGGALVGLAFVLDVPLILVIAGLTYILEMFSVILQVGYFKLTHGKRIFKMAPLHHHFEISGWKEVKVFAVFTCLTVLMCVAAWFSVLSRYPGLNALFG